MLSLALELGYANPDQMLKAITVNQLIEWGGFFKLRELEMTSKMNTHDHLGRLKGKYNG